MMIFGISMTWLEVVRLAISLIFIVFMVVAGIILWLNEANVRKLLKQGQADKAARDAAVREMLVTTNELAEKTRAALDANDQHATDLSRKIEENTEITIKAAQASAKAAEVANSVNEKIADTNQRIVDTLERKKKS